MADKPNIYQRLHAVISECPPIAKDTTVGEGRFSYKAQTYDGAISIIRPILLKHGIVTLNRVLSVVNDSYEYEDRNGNHKLGWVSHVEVEVRFVNVDDPADQFVCTAIGTGMDTQDKAAGKAYTYARKYALLHALMSVTGENEEDRPDHEAKRRSGKRSAPGQDRESSSTENQRKAIFAIGKKLYGDAFDDMRAKALGARGLTSMDELSFEQASRWIDSLKREEENSDTLDDLGV